jgi:hypothetical protein
MYVLVANGYVINGPRVWNYRSFQNSLLEELDISMQLPMQKTDGAPMDIADGVRILPVVLMDTEYNPKIEYLHGPFWDFSNDTATGTFEVHDKNIEIVRGDLKATAATERYAREVSGCTCVLQNINVSIDTTRDGRNIFVQKYLLMGDNDTVEWKFPEAWLNITKAELGEVVQCGATHIQDQFAWEAAKSAEIDTASTLAALDAIVFTD